MLPMRLLGRNVSMGSNLTKYSIINVQQRVTYSFPLKVHKLGGGDGVLKTVSQ